jgi:excisionase family DNA binding protein
VAGTKGDRALALDSSELARGVCIVGLEELIRAVVSDAMAEQRGTGSPWLNVGEAAEYLRTTEDAIRAMVRRGDVPSHRTATGRRLFRRDELDAYATAGDA